MKVPISWLREYVDFDASPEELAKRLTFSGTETDGIEQVGPNFEGIVVGEILGIDPHPGADRLLICRVGDGAQEFRVVCGAHNFSVGDKVPFARLNAVLPGGFKIEQKKIRGEVSFGMLCAEDEMEISDDHSGLMILDRGISAGTPLTQVIKTSETVLNIEVTWNRPDCLSMIGIAREVAALFGSKLKRPSVEFAENGEPVEKLAKVSVTDPDGCPRYTARVVSGVKPGSSPFWMRKRLSLCGVRPISNIVDITNYVMIECGHPLHAFDYKLLKNHEIVARRARLGEKMATLDGIERKITPDMVLIADADRPVALAGVMGGAGSEIQDDTDTVLLESATFSPTSIRRASSVLGLSTESSYRFERGVDAGGVDWASRRATGLMVAHCGGIAARGVIDVYPGKKEEKRIGCRFQRIRDLIGVDISNDQAVSIIESLNIAVAQRDKTGCVVSVPSFRPDIEIEADIIEEVARMHGLDKVPVVAQQATVVPDADDAGARAIVALRRNLVGLGLSEIMNYSFLSAQLLDKFSQGESARRVVLPNPVSADYAIMRDSLIPQMAEAMGRNLSHQIETVSFFEIGKIFLKGAGGVISEENHVAIGLMGKAGRTYLDSRRPIQREEMFMWMKGVVEACLAAQHIDEVNVAPTQIACIEDGWAVAFSSAGLEIGVMGLVAGPIRREWRMMEPVAVAEFAVEPLLKNTFAAPRAKPMPIYPSVTRDVALIVPDQITHENILNVIRKNAPRELTGVALFDTFTGNAIGQGRKSIAYSLTYRSTERTLTDEEANKYHNTIKDSLKRELNAEIREG